jgi:hypothetical protein
MLLAGDRLANCRDPISVIARSLGYESESAFSTAFKRVMSCSPRQYSHGRKASFSEWEVQRRQSSGGSQTLWHPADPHPVLPASAASSAPEVRRFPHMTE